MDIKDINFGRDTAEYDKNLKDYFVKTLTYENIKMGNKSIVIGRKGTGKTALLKYCAEVQNLSYEYVLKIEASHSTYGKLDENLRSVSAHIKNLDSSFKLAWLYTTLLALLERFVTTEEIKILKEEKEILQLAKKIHQYKNGNPFTAISSYIMSWLKSLKKIGPIERNITDDNLGFLDEPQILTLIEKISVRIAEKGKKIYLFFDKLDERWDGTELYISFLQGLLLAIKELKTSNTQIYPIILLRDDIFNIITKHFQHIDHFRMEIEYLNWDERSLLHLISLRIKSSLVSKSHKIPAELTDEEIWKYAFPEKIPARKKPIVASTYMIERTLFRPRDIVLFVNIAKEIALRNRHNQITAKDIEKAEEKYSQMKLRDIIAETSYKFRDISELLKYFKGKQIGYDLDTFRLCIIEAKENIDSNAEWLSEDEDLIIRILYTIGFLSYTKRGGILRGTRIIHSAIEPDSDILFQQKRIYISPIFRKGLELRDH